MLSNGSALRASLKSVNTMNRLSLIEAVVNEQVIKKMTAPKESGVNNYRDSMRYSRALIYPRRFTTTGKLMKVVLSLLCLAI